MAELVFLAATARTGIVASDLAAGTRGLGGSGARALGAGCNGGQWASGCGLPARGHGCGPGGRGRRRAGQAGVIDGAGDTSPDLCPQVLKGGVALALEGHKRVLLTVGAQADAPAHFIQEREVLYPEAVQDAQHDEALQDTRIVAQPVLSLLVQVIGVVEELVLDLLAAEVVEERFGPARGQRQDGVELLEEGG